VASRIDDPGGTGSIYDAWRRRAAVPDSAEPPMGDPGGGSDFAGFYNHLGIPHADWGFGAAWGAYHSNYDTYHWMETFGDPEFRYHAAAARMGAAMLLRLANAEILPYDYVEFARTMRVHLASVAPGAATAGVSIAPLHDAIGRMELAARRFAETRDAALARGAIAGAARDRANTALMNVERSLTRPEGLRGRAWYRSLIYAADVDNGYSTMVFPSIGEAMRRGDSVLATREVSDLALRFDRATALLIAAREALAP